MFFAGPRLQQTFILHSMKDSYTQACSTIPNYRGILRENEELARHTSWHVGGKAQRTYRPQDLKDLSLFLAASPLNEKLTWIGLGSNVLIRDGGINGTVIFTQGHLSGMSEIDKKTLRVEAGVPCAKLAKYCAKLGYSEAAFFAGIPGTVGGALAMNASAFGGETWPHVVAVETMNRRGEIKMRAPHDFKVGYREVGRPLDEWFVAGHFAFPRGDTEKASQAIRELLQKRSASQPIGEFSCGSVFRNPPGDHAARLIEKCGLKGLREGGAWVSEKHANFIINGGRATASDIEKLIATIKKEVEVQHGVTLISEVHIIGEENHEC